MRSSFYGSFGCEHSKGKCPQERNKPQLQDVKRLRRREGAGTNKAGRQRTFDPFPVTFSDPQQNNLLSSPVYVRHVAALGPPVASAILTATLRSTDARRTAAARGNKGTSHNCITAGSLHADPATSAGQVSPGVSLCTCTRFTTRQRTLSTRFVGGSVMLGQRN
jgi:hypothetical protein